MNKQVGELTLNDPLIILGLSCQVLAIQRHGNDDEHVTVVNWAGPISGAREHVYTITDVVEVEAQQQEGK